MNHTVRSECDLIILLWFYYAVDKLPGRRLVTMNAVYLWHYFLDEKYSSMDYKL